MAMNKSVSGKMWKGLWERKFGIAAIAIIAAILAYLSLKVGFTNKQSDPIPMIPVVTDSHFKNRSDCEAILQIIRGAYE